MPATSRRHPPSASSTDSQATADAPRCLVVDDHPAILDALGRLLADAGLGIVTLASRPEEALAAAQTEQPDLAICDVRLRGGDGLALARDIRRRSPKTALLIYTAFPERAFLHEALDAGASGFVLKDAPLAELLRAVETVRAGGTYVDGSLALHLAEQAACPERVLTSREREVLRLAADGFRVEDIGRRLFLSPATVKAHLAKAAHKLEARTRAQAVATAIRAGVIS